MKKKINSEAGLTLVEMLAAVAVLTLLVLMLSIGLQMVMSTYQTIIAQSEAELLLSSAVDALSDDLRYAWNVEPTEPADGGNVYVDFTYYSDSYSTKPQGEKTYLDLNANDQIIAINKEEDGTPKKEWQVLSTGAYGKGGVMSYKEYKVTKMDIRRNNNDNTFTIYLKVETDGMNGKKIIAETSVTVRCLNPNK